MGLTRLVAPVDRIHVTISLEALPPNVVESVGTSALEAAPAWRVETLTDGAVLLVAYENPLFIGDSYFDLLESLSLTRD